MKPRARRVTIAAAVLGTGVVAVLVVVHWGTIRDHIEAWHFQLARKTMTIAAYTGTERHLQDLPALHAASTVYQSCDLEYLLSVFVSLERPAIVEDEGGATGISWFIGEETPLGPISWKVSTADLARRILAARGYRIIEQRFPRRAYVVLAGPDRSSKEPASRGGTGCVQSDWKITEGTMSVTYGGGGMTEP